MMQIGLTGGIGSGKTTIAKLFSSLGIPVYNADVEAKKLSNTDPLIRKELVKHFGTEVYDDNKLNRAFLAQKIFNNPKALELVNGIIHPRVAQDYENWLTKHQKNEWVVKEAAILFESGASKNMDFVVTVSAPEDVRIQRVMQRDKISAQQVKERINNQISEEERNQRADYIIYNDDKNPVLPQLIELVGKFENQKNKQDE